MVATNIPTCIEEMLKHRATGPLLRHWALLSQDDEAPLKSQLDPVDFWAALPDLSINIYDPENDDYLMKLSGRNVDALEHEDHTHPTIRNNYSDKEIANLIIRKWNQARAEKKVLITFRDVLQAGKYCHSLRCSLPLREPESILNFVLYGYDPNYAKTTTPRHIDDYHDISFSIQELKDLIKLSD